MDSTQTVIPAEPGWKVVRFRWEDGTDRLEGTSYLPIIAWHIDVSIIDEAIEWEWNGGAMPITPLGPAAEDPTPIYVQSPDGMFFLIPVASFRSISEACDFAYTERRKEVGLPEKVKDPL